MTAFLRPLPNPRTTLPYICTSRNRLCLVSGSTRPGRFVSPEMNAPQAGKRAEHSVLTPGLAAIGSSARVKENEMLKRSDLFHF